MTEAADSRPESWLEESHFDVIIIGTAFTPAILAGALSRAGKKVLHLDKNDFYGESTSSFSPKGYEKVPDLGEFGIRNVTLTNNLQDDVDDRAFNIDLIPKLLYCSGEMVKGLIQSGVHKYVEFKSLQKTFLFLESDFRSVPCSKGDIFKCNFITLAEKRQLMKFVKSCMEPDFEGDQEANFEEFMDSLKLSPKLKSFIVNTIIFQTEESITTKAAVAKLQLFTSSLGKYGSETPFLFPLYGSSELTQAFCRCCAVFGGMYVLRRGPKEIKYGVGEDGTIQKSGVVVTGMTCSENQPLTCDWMVSTPTYFPDHCHVTHTMSRCVLVTSTSLQPDAENFLTIFPEASHGNKVFLLQLGKSLSVCPADTYLVYMSTTATATDSPSHDFEELISQLFPSSEGNDEPSPILWSLYFTQDVRAPKKESEVDESERNLFICEDTYSHLDFETEIQKAVEIFHRICPEADFLAPPPPPEEEVEEEEETASSESEQTDGDTQESATEEQSKEEVSEEEQAATQEVQEQVEASEASEAREQVLEAGENEGETTKDN